MTLEEIEDLWEKDSVIDESDLGTASTGSAGVAKLHHRYYKIYNKENAIYRKASAVLKKLRHDKHVFYVQGPTRETQAKGWQLPPSGKILKTEAWSYVDVDPDVMELAEKVAEQGAKIEFLSDIIKNINKRNFSIRNTMDWLKFINGS